jgi:AAA domain
VSTERRLPRSIVVEFCGLPGAGKTSLSSAVEQEWDGLLVSRPTRRIAPDVPAGRRLSRKLGLVAAEATRRPLLEARVAHRIARSRQPGAGEAAKRWIQWASTQSLMGRARRAPGVHVFDEGVLQALWSLALRGDPSATLRVLRDSTGRWSAPDLVIVLDPPVDLLVRRLRDRSSEHSRLQRLADDVELRAELVRGRSLLERLVAWWDETSRIEGSVARIGGERHDAAAAIAAAIHRIGAEPSAFSSEGRGTSAGRS